MRAWCNPSWTKRWFFPRTRRKKLCRLGNHVVVKVHKGVGWIRSWQRVMFTRTGHANSKQGQRPLFVDEKEDKSHFKPRAREAYYLGHCWWGGPGPHKEGSPPEGRGNGVKTPSPTTSLPQDSKGKGKLISSYKMRSYSEVPSPRVLIVKPLARECFRKEKAGIAVPRGIKKRQDKSSWDNLLTYYDFVFTCSLNSNQHIFVFSC